MLDAVIIADSGSDTFSASSPLRLQVDGRTALIQNVRNFVENGGRLVHPIAGENKHNWHCAPKLNGVTLYCRLRRRGHKVALIDSYFQQRREFKDLLADSPRAVVVSTTFIYHQNHLIELISDIRSLAPGIAVIAGGPFVFASYLLLQRRGQAGYDTASAAGDYLFLSADPAPEVDLYIVDRDGVSVLDQALHRIKGGRSTDDLPNTARFDGRRYVFAERKALPVDPCASAVDWSTVPEPIVASGTGSLQASIGCPFRCEFCNFVKSRRRTCIRPLPLVLKELAALCARQVQYVRFVDDNFRLGKTDLNAVCRRLADEALPIKWMSFISANALEGADVELLKKAGCIEVQIGIESADEALLKRMNKHADPQMYRRVVTRLLDAGINCSCCFIVGFPGETRATFQRTVDFINGISKVDQAGIFSWSIYPFLLAPLSPIYSPERRAPYDLTGYMGRWRHCTMDSEQARKLIVEAFLAIETAGSIYSEDNLDMLGRMPPGRRKRFVQTRHRLARQQLVSGPDAAGVLDAFSSFFNNKDNNNDMLTHPGTCLP